MYTEEEFLQISGIQHFCYCRRQWALGYIEQTWEDNSLTVGGNILHSYVHDTANKKNFKDIYCVYGLNVYSFILGVSGQCDVIEFRRDENGISIFGKEGKYIPFIVEYKHGQPKKNDIDKVQLCCYAMCLEEMLCCSVKFGAIYYGKTRHREQVEFTEELREKVRKSLLEMHDMFKRGYTPIVKKHRGCKNCSLYDKCFCEIFSKEPVNVYIKERLEEL